MSTALMASVVVMSGALAVAARPAGAFPGPTVDLVGHGYGHGRGMGQFGSLGYALKGWNYERILDHYYGGTRMGTVPDGDITVHLTKFDGIDVIVQHEHGQLRADRLPGRTFSALRARKVGPNLYRIDAGTDCAGPWQEVTTTPVGPVTFSPPDPRTNDRSQMLQVCELTGTRRWLRGEVVALEARDAANTTTSRAVNKVSLEGYIKGVVPRESPASWGTSGAGAGMHALRAQAVAARSYASAERRSDWAQTCDTQSCQVYGGKATQDGPTFNELEASTTNQAVDDTKGQVRVFVSNGSVARTEFSSSTGGYTAGGVFPPVPDEGDAVESNPSANWTARIPVTVLETARPEIGTLLSVDVTKRNGLGNMGGRVLEVVLRGSKGKATLSGADLRGLWSYSPGSRPDGLRSDWFRVVNNPSGGLSGYWVVGADGGIFSFGEARFYGSTGGLRLNSPILGLAATPAGAGYWLVAADGGIFSFGDAQFFGSTGALTLNKPVVGMAATRLAKGYWLVASDGGIFSFGDAEFFGSTGAINLNKPVVGMAPTPSGKGYWLVASDGGIFSFGDAEFFGSTGAIKLNMPIVGMAATPSGNGYWLVASDGGIFAFGDAGFYGSTGAIRLNKPVVGMAATASGRGYWLVASDGGIFAFGDAVFRGSTGAIRLNSPIIGIAPSPSGAGYVLVAADGGVFSFGDAGFFGSTGAIKLNKPVVGMAPTPSGKGYWLLAADGGLFSFGDAG
ncbi:MAG TPA: SpoIID/LytB domain-containing protein, partial [Acidimicrobiia bacterium]|nr:SpoIID/LytB domain-containing protein [Acidimicrobiia bacterium]